MQMLSVCAVFVDGGVFVIGELQDRRLPPLTSSNTFRPGHVEEWNVSDRALARVTQYSDTVRRQPHHGTHSALRTAFRGNLVPDKRAAHQWSVCLLQFERGTSDDSALEMARDYDNGTLWRSQLPRREGCLDANASCLELAWLAGLGVEKRPGRRCERRRPWRPNRVWSHKRALSCTDTQ